MQVGSFILKVRIIIALVIEADTSKTLNDDKCCEVLHLIA